MWEGVCEVSDTRESGGGGGHEEEQEDGGGARRRDARDVAQSLQGRVHV